MKYTLFILSYVCSISASLAQVSDKSANGERISNAKKKLENPYIDRPKRLDESTLKLSPDFSPEIVPKTNMKPIIISANQMYKLGETGLPFSKPDAFEQKLNRRHIYRWFREEIIGLRHGVTIGYGKQANHRLDLYVSVGYQFNTIFYLGGGQGYSLSLNNKESSAPTFANLCLNFYDEYTTPFFDIKAGYSVLSSEGIYINPNFGLSFSKEKSEKAFNVSLDYSFQRAKPLGSRADDKYHGVSLRASFEF